jgi:chitin synthase
MYVWTPSSISAQAAATATTRGASGGLSLAPSLRGGGLATEAWRQRQAPGGASGGGGGGGLRRYATRKVKLVQGFLDGTRHRVVDAQDGTLH